jgi:hypothetical protein
MHTLDKRLLEELNLGKYKPFELMRIAETLNLGNPGENFPHAAK